MKTIFDYNFLVEPKLIHMNQHRAKLFAAAVFYLNNKREVLTKEVFCSVKHESENPNLFTEFVLSIEDEIRLKFEAVMNSRTKEKKDDFITLVDTADNDSIIDKRIENMSELKSKGLKEVEAVIVSHGELKEFIVLNSIVGHERKKLYLRKTPEFANYKELKDTLTNELPCFIKLKGFDMEFGFEIGGIV